MFFFFFGLESEAKVKREGNKIQEGQDFLGCRWLCCLQVKQHLELDHTKYPQQKSTSAKV